MPDPSLNLKNQFHTQFCRKQKHSHLIEMTGIRESREVSPSKPAALMEEIGIKKLLHSLRITKQLFIVTASSFFGSYPGKFITTITTQFFLF